MKERIAEETYQMEKEKLKKRIDRILFEELNLTREEIEKYIFPFEQSGYLTAEQKLELLVTTQERRRERGEQCHLLRQLSKERKTIITEKEITESYLMRRREGECFFSWEEKKSILVCRLADQLGDGVVGLLTKIGGDAIEFGDCITSKQKEYKGKIGIRNGDEMFFFSFLGLESEEEMETIIRNLVTKEKRGEMTSQSPVWSYERPDGTKLYAVRPPVSPHWGFRIEFGKGEGKS